MKTHKYKNILASIVALIIVFVIDLSVFVSSKKQYRISRKAKNEFHNLVTINDINSTLLVEHESVKWIEGYYDPEIVVRVENASDNKVFLSSDASLTVSVFIVADDQWIKIKQNNNVHFINDGKELILYPQNVSQKNSLPITVWPILSYPNGYHPDYIERKKIVRILVVGELLLDNQKLPVGAFIDVPYK